MNGECQTNDRGSFKGLNVGIIGCGSLGAAILRGLLKNKSSELRIDTIWATTSSESSALTLQKSLESLKQQDTCVNVGHGSNVHAVTKSDVIILACPPPAMSKLLSANGMGEALSGKVLISVLGGTTRQSIEDIIGANAPKGADRCWVARALPNLAVEMGASTTAIEVSDPLLPASKAALVNNIFSQLGGIIHVPASLMDACTVLCGSAPAFVALFMDGLVDGAVVAGVPRAKANAIAAQVLVSSAALMKDGGSPSALRESVCAMPGCTVKGNLALEEGGVRVAAAKATISAITAASQLG